MPQEQTLTRTRITGEIVQIRFQNPENGFAVVTLKMEDGRKFAAKGNLFGIGEGETVEADGYFENHPDFGRQFRIETCRAVLPSTTAGIERFLCHAVPGIGPKTAKTIVGFFGKETVTILDLYPKRLMEIPKIGKAKAAAISEAWKKSRDKRDDMIFLQGLGITPAYCNKLFRQYGKEAVSVVRSNPYRLAEDVNGIGFLRADAVARALGFAADSDERMEAGAVFELNTMLGEGHVCCPVDELVRRVSELTQQPAPRVQSGIAKAFERKLICLLDDYCYTPYPAIAETKLPELLLGLATFPRFAGKQLASVMPRADLILAPEQLEAVEAVARRPLTIITGGPGVGKTTVIGEIVRRAKKAKLSIALAAPTGRAAKRMSESCGEEAKTLHRLLNFDPTTGKFVHNRNNPLECELLIVDEVSMLDIILAYQLFQSLKPGTSVVLVGDADQLPSVGPGKVLFDLMGSGLFGVTRLTKVFRQGAGSTIITNAHRVNHGMMPAMAATETGKLADFYWIAQDDPERAAELIETLVAERIPKRFGFDPMTEIQVLCPMNRGSCGTAALNEKLAAALNGKKAPELQCGSRSIKSGDRVMQIANNYDKGVFNGDLGQVIQLDPAAKKFVVEFDAGHFVVYTAEEAEQLVPAYAITIHKSQGSEFPAVVMPLLTQHYVMLQRNLLYTGMTRAKKLLILVGSVKAVELAVRNTRIRPRYSLLDRRIAAQISQNGYENKFKETPMNRSFPQP